MASWLLRHTVPVPPGSCGHRWPASSNDCCRRWSWDPKRRSRTGSPAIAFHTGVSGSALPPRLENTDASSSHDGLDGFDRRRLKGADL